jgi:two-component system, OmpR family, response regulator VicR
MDDFLLPANTSTLGVIGADLDSKKDREPQKILIIDDDVDYVDMLKIVLRKAGFDVAGAYDYQSAIQKTYEVNPDIILLDLMIPEVDGWGIFQRLRQVTKSPVIFVSGAPLQENVLKGFEVGAEDFIAKPFHNPELIARINRILRNPAYTYRPNLRHHLDCGIEIDLDSHEVTRKGRPVHLLSREFSLLQILAQSAPHNVSYETITTKMWGQDSAKNRSHLKTVAFSLKRKLQEDAAEKPLIVNNRGIGYQLVALPEQEF